MFQKRHYEEIARLIQDANAPMTFAFPMDQERWKRLVNNFTAFFERDNPRFDSARFRAACEPGADVRKRK